MSLRILVTVTAVGFWVLCTLCPTPAAYGPLNHACCVKYTRTPLAFRVIKGYYEQDPREVCRISAIVFFTKRNKKVCASTEDEWVKIILKRLSDKMNKISRQQSKHAITDTSKFSTWTTFSNS
ncbi:C-C motif chemokine 20 [Electrophorus electricus]|uniref:Chemokine interleukin-8-like domain-containing protein n=1 Tax=Electrophorus electricus TaxID=8005 RepID=A0A4W4EWF9_ELEEL|nr:C-C motif chemokine 20 [Electrophorus electricus]